MKIAILDNKNEDIGLKILFPEADYYYCSTTSDRNESYLYYNFRPRLETQNITDKNYDVLFVIMPVRHVLNDEVAVRDIRGNYDNIIKPIIFNNNFKYLAFFDNEDYDVNPNKYIKHPNIHFFKRNYDKKVNYENNVYPFPFIMFGKTSLIEKIDRQLVPKEKYFSNKIERVFYTGGLYHHHSTEFGVDVNRIKIYNEIKHFIKNPGSLPNNVFIQFMRDSNFCVDLLGAGNPNIRTFEILVSGSLLLQEKNDLVWPFSEKFSEECYFKDGMEFNKNLYKLHHNPELYLSCLENQYNIVNKYFNKEWLKNYILSKINID
jgi:hypothetical protein